jgi:hypothetical protein
MVMNGHFEGIGHESVVECFNVQPDNRLERLRNKLGNIRMTRQFSFVRQNFDLCEWPGNSPGGGSPPSHFRSQKRM